MENYRKYCKHIFVDVVGFTKDRTSEDQVAIITELNTICQSSVESLTEAKVLYAPTGDGLCISLIEAMDFDVQFRIALKILSEISRYNENCERKQRRFELRIGIDENYDTIVTDINQKENIIGAGINRAARIMDSGDKSQIVISQTTYDALSHSTLYSESFAKVEKKIKHGQKLNTYFYLGDEDGVRNTLPNLVNFQDLTTFQSYYLLAAVCFEHHEVKEDKIDQFVYDTLDRFALIALRTLDVEKALLKVQDPAQPLGLISDKDISKKITHLTDNVEGIKILGDYSSILRKELKPIQWMFKNAISLTELQPNVKKEIEDRFQSLIEVIHKELNRSEE